MATASQIFFGKTTSTGQRVIWLMNGASYSSFVDLGTVGDMVEHRGRG